MSAKSSHNEKPSTPTIPDRLPMKSASGQILLWLSTAAVGRKDNARSVAKYSSATCLQRDNIMGTSAVSGLAPDLVFFAANVEQFDELLEFLDDMICQTCDKVLPDCECQSKLTPPT